MQRRDQLGGGLAVVGTAALLEQLRFLIEGRVLVHLQQRPLDRHDLLGARSLAPGKLLGQDLPGAVVVPEVIGRNRTKKSNEVDRNFDLGRDLSAGSLDQVREPILGVDHGGALPGQVIQAHVLERDVVGCDAQQAGDHPLKANRRVAEPNGTMALVEQGLHHDAHRVGEVDDPGVLRGPAAHLLGDVEDNRDGAQRLGEAAGAGGFLTDGRELERQRLIEQAGLLAAHPQLDDDEVGALQRLAPISGQRQNAGPAAFCQHAAGKPTDNPESLGIHVQEDQLVDWQAAGMSGKALDQFRRVGAASANHGNLDAHVERCYAKERKIVREVS